MARILVVDDDGDVRDVIVAMLQTRGFEPVPASGGDDMRNILASAGPFHAVVLDSLLPGEATAPLARHANRLRIPVLMISGNPEVMASAAESYQNFLQKPFSIDALVDAVTATIDIVEFDRQDSND